MNLPKNAICDAPFLPIYPSVPGCRRRFADAELTRFKQIMDIGILSRGGQFRNSVAFLRALSGDSDVVFHKTGDCRSCDFFEFLDSACRRISLRNCGVRIFARTFLHSAFGAARRRKIARAQNADGFCVHCGKHNIFHRRKCDIYSNGFRPRHALQLFARFALSIADCIAFEFIGGMHHCMGANAF